MPPARRLTLQGRPVEYRVSRSGRRSIAILIDADGVAVRAPWAAPSRAIEAFIAAKARWILARLDASRNAPRPVRVHGISGETIPVMGEQLRLDVRRGAGAAGRTTGALALEVRNPLDEVAVRAALVGWLKRTALEAFAPCAAAYAARFGLAPPRVALSAARLRWGSCSPNGRIRLAWRLVHVAPHLADYVICHEVAHLVEANHSPRFWGVVESMYPDFRAARRGLRLAGAAIPLIEGPP